MGNNDIDFKKIWQQHQADQPDMETLHQKLKQYKRSGLRRLFISNIMLVVTSFLILLIWYTYQPQFVSTKIGIILTILAMILYLFTYNKLFSVYKQIDSAQTNKEYLHGLQNLKIKQKFMQTIVLNIYFLILSTGICMYMYEYTSRMTAFWAIFAYGITLAWIGFNWIYVKPRTIRKQNEKLDALLLKFENLNQQLNT